MSLIIIHFDFHVIRRHFSGEASHRGSKEVAAYPV
jgi:hypothetical protein